MKHTNRLTRILLALTLFVSALGFPMQSMANEHDVEESDESTVFSDIEGHKNQADIEKAYGYRLLNGFEDGTFRPDQPMTRGEFVTALGIFTRSHSSFFEEQGLIFLPLLIDSRFSKPRLPYQDVHVGDILYKDLLIVEEATDALMGSGEFHAIFPGSQFNANETISVEEAGRLMDAYYFFVSPDGAGDVRSEAISRLAKLRILEDSEVQVPLTRALAAQLLARSSDVLSMSELMPTVPTNLRNFTYDVDTYNSDLLFGSYSSNELTEDDRAYLKAVDDIQQGDETEATLATLQRLKQSNYRNQVGVLYYLVYLDESTGSVDRHEMLVQALESLSRDIDSTLAEWLAVVDALQGNAEHAKVFSKNLDAKQAIQRVLSSLRSELKPISRMLTAYLAWLDVREGNASAAISKYIQVIDLEKSSWAFHQLAKAYAQAGQSQQAVQKFEAYLGQSDIQGTPLHADLQLIIADFEAAGNQQQAIDVLEEMFQTLNVQKGSKVRTVYLENGWYGVFQQVADYVRGAIHVTGKYYYGGISLTPKKYEEYIRATDQGSQNYYFTSDIKEWKKGKPPKHPSLSGSIQQMTLADRQSQLGARYLLKETDRHFVVYEVLSPKAMEQFFSGQTFNDGKITSVDRYAQRYVINKQTMLPIRDHWDYRVSFDSSYYPSQQFGWTDYVKFGALEVSIPQSVIQKAKSEE
jgi:tetratricopeptide (TPR) repeat protein